MTKRDLYRHLERELRATLAGERDAIANLANAAALVWEIVPRLNWAGFYLLRGDELVLGPFQGRAACTRIAPGQGVCGAAAERRETLFVPDVRRFPGHIACDAASRSEIVVPLVKGGKDEMDSRDEKDGELIGVLDLDSPELDRFDAEDAAGLETFARALIELTNLSRI
jgi:GAF domain-containing protein